MRLASGALTLRYFHNCLGGDSGGWRRYGRFLLNVLMSQYIYGFLVWFNGREGSGQ